jgi:hypothetical protein
MYEYGWRDSQAAHDNDPAQHGSHVLAVLDECGCEDPPSVPPVQAQRRRQPWESVPAKKENSKGKRKGLLSKKRKRFEWRRKQKRKSESMPVCSKRVLAYGQTHIFDRRQQVVCHQCKVHFSKQTIPKQ